MYVRYSKTCLIWHLWNPFHPAFWPLFSFSISDFHCFLHYLFWYTTYHDKISVSQCLLDKTGFTVVYQYTNLCFWMMQWCKRFSVVWRHRMLISSLYDISISRCWVWKSGTGISEHRNPLTRVIVWYLVCDHFTLL